MGSPLEDFQALSPARKRALQLALCERALERWNRFVASGPALDYVETVCGTRQQVDPALPYDALTAAKSGSDLAEVGRRYLEPIAAMQDDDLEFPDDVEFAYYALYNLFRRHVEGAPIDDWLIVNQALSCEAEISSVKTVLEEALRMAATLSE